MEDVLVLNGIIGAGSVGWTTALLSGDNIVAIVLGFFTFLGTVFTAWLTHRGNKETRKRRLVVTDRGETTEVANEDTAVHDVELFDQDADAP